MSLGNHFRPCHNGCTGYTTPGTESSPTHHLSAVGYIQLQIENVCFKESVLFVELYKKLDISIEICGVGVQIKQLRILIKSRITKMQVFVELFKQ